MFSQVSVLCTLSALCENNQNNICKHANCDRYSNVGSTVTAHLLCLVFSSKQIIFSPLTGSPSAPGVPWGPGAPGGPLGPGTLETTEPSLPTVYSGAGPGEPGGPGGPGGPGSPFTPLYPKPALP